MAIEPVQTGFWIDYSKGPLFGATLTCNTQRGSLLLTTATVIVSITQTAAWTLVAFWMHQYLVSTSSHDEFDAQRTVILRNSGALSSIYSLYTLGKTWHKHAPNAWWRALSTMMFPLVIVSAFAIAGIWVASITLNPLISHALVQPGRCGSLRTDSNAGRTVHLQQTLYYLNNNVTLSARTYVQDCYAHQSWSQPQCASFAVPAIRYENGSGRCPAGPNRCGVSDDHIVTYTAKLDSHYDMGVNAKVEDRLEYGYNLTCAPAAGDLIDTLVVQKDLINYEDQDYEAFILNVSNAFDSNHVPSSLQSIKPTAISDLSGALGGNDYRVQTFPTQDTGIPGVDLTYILIDMASILYAGVSSDPVFATEKASHMNGTEVGELYRPLNIASLMICGESHQVCNPQSSKCTPWAGQAYFSGRESNVFVDGSIAPMLDLNQAQNATFQRMNPITTSVSVSVIFQSSSPLQASQKIVLPPYSVQLPSNQWELEVEFWFQTVLASMQIIQQGWVMIPDWLADIFEIQKGDTPELQAQCFTQRRLLPTGYQSYSVFGLVFTAAIGTACILTALIIRGFHGKLLPHRKTGQKNHGKFLAFITDGQLHLHRLALEGLSFRGWMGTKEVVPYVPIATKRLPVAVLAEEREAKKGDSQTKQPKKTSDTEDDSEGLLTAEGDIRMRAWDSGSAAPPTESGQNNVPNVTQLGSVAVRY